MAEAIPMLALSPTMTEGTIAAWKFKEGDQVKKGSVLCEVETDKAVMDYESSSAGVLLMIAAPAGSSVSVGDLIAVVGSAGEDISAILAKAGASGPGAGSSAAQASLAAKPAGASASQSPAVETQAVAAPASATSPPAPTAPFVSAQVRTPALVAHAVPFGGPPLASGYPRSSPLARSLAREAGVDLRAVTPSGPAGRVVKRDVAAYIASGAANSSRAGTWAAAETTSAQTSSARAVLVAKPILEDRIVPLSRLRATIAKRLGDSMREAPHFFLRSAVETDALLELRRRWNEGRAEGDRISLNALFVKLAAAALARNPAVNVFWRGDALEYRRSVDIGLAVALDEGLVAPVVRDCVHKGAMELELEFRELIARAKTGGLRPEDYEGASFTISNLGAWGVEEFTAIINPPGSAILALGSVAREPVVRQGRDGSEEIVIRSMLRATLSCDHRSIDGAVGAAFLRDLSAMIQEPGRAIL